MYILILEKNYDKYFFFIICYIYVILIKCFFGRMYFVSNILFYYNSFLKDLYYYFFSC